MIGQLIFIIILLGAAYLFGKNAAKVRRNILLGRDIYRSDQPALRWKVMAKVALGQTKMVKRPVAAVMHFFIYIGFTVPGFQEKIPVSARGNGRQILRCNFYC